MIVPKGINWISTINLNENLKTDNVTRIQCYFDKLLINIHRNAPVDRKLRNC